MIWVEKKKYLKSKMISSRWFQTDRAQLEVPAFLDSSEVVSGKEKVELERVWVRARARAQARPQVQAQEFWAHSLWLVGSGS